MKYQIIEKHNKELDNKLSDCTSSLYGQLYNGAALLGPIVGGSMYEIWSFKTLFDITMCFELVLGLLFMYFNCGRNVRENSDKLKDEIKRL